MKKVIKIFVAALVIVAIAPSCQPVEKYSTPDSVSLYTKVSTPVGKSAGEKRVTITATAPWFVYTDATWIEIGPGESKEGLTRNSEGQITGGKGIHEVVLSYTENTTGAERSAAVVFSTVNKNQVFGKQYSETFTLTQKSED